MAHGGGCSSTGESLTACVGGGEVGVGRRCVCGGGGEGVCVGGGGKKVKVCVGGGCMCVRVCVVTFQEQL